MTSLGRFWGWLRTQFIGIAGGAARGISRTLRASIERLRGAIRQARPGFNPFQAISRRLPPRQRVLLTYLLMVRWNTQNGFKRLPHQTPYEYAHRLIVWVPAAQTDLEMITQLFMEARYSRHTITPEQADSAQAAWEQVQKIFQDYLAQQKAAPA